MNVSRKVFWLPAFSCLCVAGLAGNAQAQFGIDFAEDGSVRVQNGAGAPLVVGPGQSFGGTLTQNGFQGVKTGPDQRTTPVVPSANPFAKSRSATAPGLRVNTGNMSINLPGVNLDNAVVGVSDGRTTDRVATARELAKSAPPVVVLRMVDELLTKSPGSPDLLQLKATLLLQQQRTSEAAACVYEALSAGAVWNWPTLRSRFSSNDQVVEMYRRLQDEAANKPSLEADFVLAWWEQMLGHQAESLQALQRAQAAKPDDALLARLMEEWAVKTTEAPPSARP